MMVENLSGSAAVLRFEDAAGELVLADQVLDPFPFRRFIINDQHIHHPAISFHG